MRFIDIDQYSVDKSLFDGEYYHYVLGRPVEVISMQSTHRNRLISDNTAVACKEDRLMLKYTPTYEILFTKSYITEKPDSVSCKIDAKSNSVFIGTVQEFGSSGGILAFSGYLSANNLVERNRPIYCTKRNVDILRDRVRLLAVGMRGEELFGIFYIPALKGILLGDGETFGVSANTYRSVFCSDYARFYIKDWFQSARLKAGDQIC